MKRTLIITAIVFAVITIAMIIFNKVASKSNKDNTFTEAKRGLFELLCQMQENYLQRMQLT